MFGMKKQVGIKKRCKIKYGFDFEEEFRHWIYVTGAGEEFEYLDNKYEPLDGVDSIKSWKKYIKDKYRENDSEFIDMLKIIRENKSFEAGIIGTFSVTIITGTLIKYTMDIILKKFGEIISVLNNIKINLSLLITILKNLKYILFYEITIGAIIKVIFFIIFTMILSFFLYISVKRILKNINKQNLQQVFIESVMDVLMIK